MNFSFREYKSIPLLIGLTYQKKRNSDDDKNYPKRFTDSFEMFKTNEILKLIIRYFIYKE